MGGIGQPGEQADGRDNGVTPQPYTPKLDRAAVVHTGGRERLP